MVSCVSECALVHPCLYVYKHAWMSPHVSYASVFVGVHICKYACMCVCVCIYIYIYNSYFRISAAQYIYIYIIHIYAFLLHSGAVFHSSGTFIFGSTDGYLAFVYLNMIYTAHFVFTFSTALLDPVSCCTWTGNNAHHTATAYHHTLYTRRCYNISQFASSHDTVNVVCKWWCLERHSALPYDNMAT